MEGAGRSTRSAGAAQAPDRDSVRDRVPAAKGATRLNFRGNRTKGGGSLVNQGGVFGVSSGKCRNDFRHERKRGAERAQIGLVDRRLTPPGGPKRFFDRNGELTDRWESHEAGGGLEGMRYAVQTPRRSEVAGIGAKIGECRIDAVEKFGHLLDKYADQFRYAFHRFSRACHRVPPRCLLRLLISASACPRLRLSVFCVVDSGNSVIQSLAMVSATPKLSNRRFHLRTRVRNVAALFVLAAAASAPVSNAVPHPAIRTIAGHPNAAARVTPGIADSLRRTRAGRLRSVQREAHAARDTIRTGRIVIAGNARIRSGVILREIPLHPGEPFDYRLLQRARSNLRRIAGIDYSEVRVQYQPEDSSLGLRVFLTEVPTIEGTAWLQRGPENDYSVGVGFRDANFRGNGERVMVSGLFFNDTAGRVHWENPWLGANRHRLGIGIAAWHRSYRYVYDDFGGRYNGLRIRRDGLLAMAIHESPPPAPQPWQRPGSLRSRLRSELFAGIETIDSEIIAGAHATGRNTEVETGVRVSRDTRTSTAFPFTGSLFTTRLAWIFSLDRARPVREAFVDARRFVPLGGRIVAAARLRTTLRGGSNFAYRREHTGGGKSLRGWPYGSFHGYSAAVGTVELRLPLNFDREEPLEEVLLGLEVHAFADGAAAWDRFSTLSRDDVFAGYGIGVGLLNRQVRGLRVDWGFARHHKSRVHVEVGLSF